MINGVFAYTAVQNFDKIYMSKTDDETVDEGAEEQEEDATAYKPKEDNERTGADKAKKKAEQEAPGTRQRAKPKRSNTILGHMVTSRLSTGSFSNLEMLGTLLNKLATMYAPKLVLIMAYHASQVDPLKVIFAQYLIPVAALLCFGSVICKHVWQLLVVQASLSWMITYTWQFEICRSVKINDIWGLTQLAHMWDERLLVHIWVLVAVGLYRALCKDKRIEKLTSEPLFEGAWPHLSSAKLDASDDKRLRLKFFASHFLLAFGQTIFFTTCLFSATLRRDNFSILYVLNLGVFFLSNRTQIIKGMQVNFVLLVLVQICVVAAALTNKIYQQYGIENPDGIGGDILGQTMKVFLYFSQNDNDATTTPVDESLNISSFAILFVMSAILHNEKQAKKMVKQHDQKLLLTENDADGENYQDAWGDTRGEQRLLDTIERLCFIYSIPLERSFKNLEQINISGKFHHACSIDEFVSRVKKGMGKRLKRHIPDDAQLQELLGKLGRSEPWKCPRDHFTGTPTFFKNSTLKFLHTS